MGSAAPWNALAQTTEMSGRVVEGRRLGRLIGVPTANIALVGCDAALYGSWAAVARTGGRSYRAIAHVGVRPSVGGAEPLLEVHLFDYEGNLYGHSIRVRLLRKVSGEVRLESLDLLRLKIAADVRDVRRYFDGMNGLDPSAREPAAARS